VVHQDDGAVVLHVSNHPTDGLVDSPCSLLRIPLGASESNLADLVLLL